MRIKAIAFFLFIGMINTSSVFAHPGTGIVMDSKGNVFYTDLVHVWKISTEGDVSIAVEDVHTHQLYLDSDDNLYGEHVWYNGEARDTWSYYVWCLSSTGELEQTVPPTEEFPVNNTLVRDLEGSMFYSEKDGDHDLLMKETLGGVISTHSEHKFRDIRWIQYSEDDNNLYVVDYLGLKRVSADGSVTILSENLRESGRAFAGVRDMHYVMGTWTDDRNQAYVAVYGGKKVNRFNSEGDIESVYESPSFWSPCGGLIAPVGSMWVMEFSNRNNTRVKKIAPNGEETVYKS